MNKLAAQILFVVIFAAPLLMASIGMLLPAFGFIELGQWQAPSLSAWQALIKSPGLGRSVLLSLMSGLLATIFSFALSQAFVTWRYRKQHGYLFDSLSRLLLAAPHVSMAVATAFLLTPSGFLARLISPWLTDWQRPADYLLPNDPYAGSLILGLVLKETAFLLVVSMIAVNQIKPKQHLDVARSLGYSFAQSWVFVVIPEIIRRIRLSIFIVLAFSVSAVEQALVLGPNQPPTFSVKLLQWFSDGDLLSQQPLAAGSVLLVMMTGLAFVIWRFFEGIVKGIFKQLAYEGYRQKIWSIVVMVLSRLAALLIVVATMSLLILCLQSLTQGWRFPDLIPSGWSLSVWSYNSDLLVPALVKTLWLGLLSALVSVALALTWLEANPFTQRFRHLMKWITFIPLFAPQVSIMFGLSLGWNIMRIDGFWFTVLWAHVLFCLPYAWLMLADSFNAIDRRLIQTARTLGASRFRVFFDIKLPLLKQPIANAIALTFLVSASLYLPTLFAGGGRFSTVTIETMALAGSGNRRLLGALTVVQMILPLVALLLAKWLPLMDVKRRIRRHSNVLNGVPS